MSNSTTGRRLSTLSIGGATYDIFLTIGSMKAEGDSLKLKLGGKMPVDRVVETCGGGACNTSVGLSRLGCDAAFCGVVGSDQWGDKLLQTMKKENVRTDAATVVEHETSSFSIVLSMPGGDRTILYTPGVNEHLHDVTFDLDAIAQADAVYLNHLCETSCAIEDNLAEALVKKPAMHLTWNPGGCQIARGMDHTDTKALLSITTLLLLNKEEALEFTKTATIDDALNALTKAGVKNVCVTDGKRGVTATDGKHVYHCPILADVKVIDTTGAGDAFGTGATWALLQGLSLPKSLIAGTLSAASVVGAIGAQAGLLTHTDLNSRMKSSSLTVDTIR